MARYGLVWLEIARKDYASLADDTRAQISTRIEQLLEDPRHPRDGYDGRYDGRTGDTCPLGPKRDEMARGRPGT